MEYKKLTPEQIRMLVIGFAGLFFLTIQNFADVFLILIGILLFVFAGIMFYREFFCKFSKTIKEKLVSGIIVLFLFLISVVLILRLDFFYPFLCFVCGVVIVFWGVMELIGSNTMSKVYLSLVFAVVGTVLLFIGSRQSDTLVHISGLMLSYYEFLSFFKSKYGG